MWGLKCSNFGHSIHPWKPTQIKAQQENVLTSMQKVLTVRHCQLSILPCQNVLWISSNPNSVSVQLLDIDTSEVLSMYFQSKCWEPSKTRSLGATASRMDLSWSIRAMVRHLLGLKLGKQFYLSAFVHHMFNITLPFVIISSSYVHQFIMTLCCFCAFNSGRF